MDRYEVFAQAAIDDAALDWIRVGKLKLRGRIGAADPLTADRIAAFDQAVPEGTFPVDVLVVRTANDQRVAFARVLFRDEAPVRFELAASAGRTHYDVDAGMGCFAVPGAKIDSEKLLDDIRDTTVPTWSWAVQRGVVAFSSGVGDGGYRSYFGFDAAGAPVCLVTDFEIVDLEAPGKWKAAKPNRRPKAALTGKKKKNRALEAMFKKSEAMTARMMLHNAHGEVRARLASGSADERIAAAHALRSEPVLLEVAANEAVDLEIRFACIARLEGENTRCHGFVTLAEAGHAEAVDRLVKLLKARLAPPDSINEWLDRVAAKATSPAVLERVTSARRL